MITMNLQCVTILSLQLNVCAFEGLSQFVMYLMFVGLPFHKLFVRVPKQWFLGSVPTHRKEALRRMATVQTLGTALRRAGHNFHSC